MSIRAVKSIREAVQTMEGAGVELYRAFGFTDPSELDPFLLFDDFRNDNPKSFEKGFPWHPHRGIETITYVLEGNVDHADSLGNSGSLGAGDIQWMTTGSGLIHSELVTDKFKKSGGVMQGLQIWVNLPQKNKNVKPWYQHIKKNDIPTIDEGNDVLIKVLVGEVKNTSSAVQTYSPVSIFDVQFTKPSLIDLDISKNQTLMVYVIDGELKFHDDNQIARKGQMIYFDQLSDTINLTSISPTGSYLVLAGEPLNEPVVRYGPFVTNTEGDMKKSMLDYQNGKMGTLS